MDNPEKLGTLGTQEQTQNNGQSRETGNIGYTRVDTERNTEN